MAHAAARVCLAVPPVCEPEVSNRVLWALMLTRGYQMLHGVRKESKAAGGRLSAGAMI